MKIFFNTCCKIYGLYLVLQLLKYLVLVGLGLPMVSELAGISTPVYLVLAAASCLMNLFFIYLFLFQTEKIAEGLKIPDGGWPPISLRTAFHAGLLLSGSILMVHCVISGSRSIIDYLQLRVFFSQGDYPVGIQTRELLKTVLPTIAGLAFAFVFLRYPNAIMKWLNIPQEPEAPGNAVSSKMSE